MPLNLFIISFFFVSSMSDTVHHYCQRDSESFYTIPCENDSAFVSNARDGFSRSIRYHLTYLTNQTGYNGQKVDVNYGQNTKDTTNNFR